MRYLSRYSGRAEIYRAFVKILVYLLDKATLRTVYDE